MTESGLGGWRLPDRHLRPDHPHRSGQIRHPRSHSSLELHRLAGRHEDLLDLRRTQVGIEASNEKQRDELNKQLSSKTVEEAVRLLREHDIVCQGMMIGGLPSDSPATFEEKVRLVNRLNIDFPVFLLYTLFPGAPDYDQAIAEGHLELPADNVQRFPVG